MESATQLTPGWYQRFFAWLMAHGNAKYESEISDRQRELFSDLHGNVLEIGSGTGANLRYYPSDIHWTGIEQNTYIICIPIFSKKQKE